MKNVFRLSGAFLLILSIFIILSCDKDEPEPEPTPAQPVINLPVVVTIPAMFFTQTEATSGGSITDGADSILGRGVCWNTKPNPIISDSKTSDGAGAGVFISLMTGLTLNTTYYVKAYATNKAGTGYGEEVHFTTVGTLSVGNSYQGGKIFYILKPGDLGYDVNVQHGLIAAPSDQIRGGIQWFNGKNIKTGASGGTIGAGNANTNAIVASQGDGSYAAKLCYDLVLGIYSGGLYTDWYLPSKDELYQLCLNKDLVGLDEGFSNYWSSSEADADFACAYDIGSNSLHPLPSVRWINKYFNCSVRAIRSF